MRLEDRKVLRLPCVDELKRFVHEPRHMEPPTIGGALVEDHVAAIHRSHTDRRTRLTVDADRCRPLGGIAWATHIEEVAAGHRATVVHQMDRTAAIDRGMRHPSIVRNPHDGDRVRRCQACRDHDGSQEGQRDHQRLRPRRSPHSRTIPRRTMMKLFEVFGMTPGFSCRIHLGTREEEVRCVNYSCF